MKKFSETLDMSELMDVKGGKKDNDGGSGTVICIFTAAIKCTGNNSAVSK